MDKLIEQALKKHGIVRYLDTFEEVMLTYRSLLEAEMEAKNLHTPPVGGSLPNVEKLISTLNDLKERNLLPIFIDKNKELINKLKDVIG